ncbi:hypothetical protein BIW11_02399 [Tropilaelaps mercedesae]|uniref:tRNA-specific adenosine deaminase 1 n=1 Tax=Tropilaelaps mercedesae TaxID=418985 RepID=A0A1V9WY75_9ACAR|nr:hypothetical protein BIW11_02399 [Tropilaelaps mercedesae]
MQDSDLASERATDQAEKADVSIVVSQIVLDRFTKLPRNGKPSDAQWTVLAGLVAVPTGRHFEQAKLISLSTGTKCLGRSQRRPGLVADSHAEVLARRLFNRQLLDEVHTIVRGKSSSFLSIEPDGRCAWREDRYSLYMYVSHAPCGDSVICNKDRTKSCGLALDDTVALDINRTGAKPVPLGGQDPLRPGKGYHTIGLLRTKPGRGESTNSMSCSDKISRWVACGIQSRLLGAFLARPIPLAGLIIGGEVFDESALRRAIVERHSCPLDTLKIMPAPHSFVFRHGRRQGAECCCTSLLVRVNNQEVAVDGRRHGVVKKFIGTPKAELGICRRQLLMAFRDLVHDMLENGDVRANVRLAPLLTTSYAETKEKATPAWLAERRSLFDSKMPHWTCKEGQDFSL